MKISNLEFVGERIAARLIDSGYRTTSDLQEASAEDLLAIDGIGIATVYRLLDVENEPQVVTQ